MQQYCERCGPGLWDEPVNAATNAVFLLAALAAWWVASGRRGLTPGVWLLIALAATVGVGSFLWHTFATPWAMWLDIVPITLFECAFLVLYCWRGEHFPWWAAAALVPFIALSFALGEVKWLNQALMYAPVVVALWAVGLHHLRTSREEPLLLLFGAVFFCLALFFRTIDLMACPRFPVGTHFLWHVFNGAVVYAAMRGVILRNAVVTSESRKS